MDTLLLASLMALIIFSAGSTLQNGFGFGMGPLVMGLLPLFLPFNDAVLIFQIVAIISNLYLSIKYIRFIRWRALLPILIPTLLISTITTFFAVNINSSYIYLALGIILVIISSIFFFFSNKINIKPNILTGSVIGIVCGVCGGFFGLSGPFAAFYFLPALKNKKEYLASFQMFFLITNLANISVRIFKGAFEISNYPVILTSIVGLVIGIILGSLIFKKINGVLFEKIVYALVGLNGLWIIISHFLGI